MNQNVTHIRINKYKTGIGFIVSFLLFFCPILSLPLILIEIYNGRKYAVVLFFFFLCIVAFHIPPIGDLYRYYSWYYLSFKDIPFFEIFEFYITDVSWYAILYYVSNLDLPFQYAVLISGLIQYTILFYLLYELKVFQEKNKIKRFWIIIASSVFTSFWTSFFIARYYLGASFFMLSLFFLYKNDNKKAFFWMFFAALSHFTFIGFGILTYLCYRFGDYITTKKAIILGIIIYVIIMGVGTYLESIGFKARYITGASDWKDSFSLGLKIVDAVASGVLYVVSIFFILLNRNPRGTILYKIAVVLVALSITTYPFPDLFQRTQYLVVVTGWLIFLIDRFRMASIWIHLFIISSLVSFFFSCLIYYRGILVSPKSYLWTPIPISLLKDNYPQIWVERHVDNGDLKKL